jgi:hypothetical protein
MNEMPCFAKPLVNAPTDQKSSGTGSKRNSLANEDKRNSLSNEDKKPPLNVVATSGSNEVKKMEPTGNTPNRPPPRRLVSRGETQQ